MAMSDLSSLIDIIVSKKDRNHPFYLFMKKEHAEENLDFLMDCDRLSWDEVNEKYFKDQELNLDAGLFARANDVNSDKNKLLEDAKNFVRSQNFTETYNRFLAQKTPDLKAPNLNELIPVESRKFLIDALQNYIDDKKKSNKNEDYFFAKAFLAIVNAGELSLGRPFDKFSDASLQAERIKKIDLAYKDVKNDFPKNRDGISSYQNSLRNLNAINEIHIQMQEFWKWLDQNDTNNKVGLKGDEHREGIQKALCAGFAFQLAGKHFQLNQKSPTIRDELRLLQEAGKNLYADPRIKIQAIISPPTKSGTLRIATGLKEASKRASVRISAMLGDISLTPEVQPEKMGKRSEVDLPGAPDSLHDPEKRDTNPRPSRK